MKTNLDHKHRLIRLILGVALVLVEYKFKIHVGLLYLGVLMGLTGLFGFCPFMAIFKKG